jgi:aldehyde:ferredoxin oxidoreductase
MDLPGFAGKLLRVNLEKKTTTVEPLDESYHKHYLGGRGLIIQKLITEVPPRTDPLSPENKLIFAAGTLTGHKLIGTGRVSVGSKSPLTGGFGESEASGYWGPQLRRAGYDGLIIEGASRDPVCLVIDNESVEIRDASKIWGAEIRETTDWIRRDSGEEKSSIAAIGPAGEQKVRFANIMVDYSHAFGRGGMGAIMGSKRLKGIAVRGDTPPPPARPERLSELNKIMLGRYKNSPFAKYGTGSAMKKYEAVGNLPIRNHSGGRFPAVEKIDAIALLKEYGAGMETCFNCPIRCKKKIKNEEGPWAVDSCYGGPEYETLASFGSNLLIDDLQAVCKAHEMCNRLGLDTISTGGTIAFAMECFENGILTTKETGGTRLNFGNAEAMLEMIDKIAYRQGIGDVLANGSKGAAETIGKGSERFAIHVKGLEIPYHEPRYKPGLGLHYSIHATGADHCTGVMDDRLEAMLEEWESLNIGELIPPSELSPRKVRMVYELGPLREMPNSIGLCIFVPWNFREIRDAVSAVTGWEVTSSKLIKAVERGITLMRIFNLREGFTREQDRLPDRFHTSPPEGPLEGVTIEAHALQGAQGLYYQMMGWNPDGVPTQGCLVALDLEWAIPHLKE